MKKQTKPTPTKDATPPEDEDVTPDYDLLVGRPIRFTFQIRARGLKGASGTFGFSNIADFTHVMETLLGEMRDRQHEVTRDLVDLLL